MTAYCRILVGVHQDRSQVFTYLFFSLLFSVICLFDSGRPMYAHVLRAKGWSLVYEHKLCGLFVRNDFKEKRILEHAPVPHVPINGLGMQFE
jgi:hypothetical protein